MPPPTNVTAGRKSSGRAVGLWTPTWWAPNGFDVIPTTALDPPQRAASPAVPALIGSGSPSAAMPTRTVVRPLGSSRSCFDLSKPLEFGQYVAMMLCEIADHSCITEQFAEVAISQH